MARGWRFSGWMVAAVVTAAGFAIQIPVIPGFYLLFLFAPFWSIVLVNLTLILMARDAWVGDTPRWLLVVPILFYGGNLALSAVSHVQFWMLGVEVGRSNDAGRVTFDPSAMSLVADDVYLPSDLVIRYRLDVAFSLSPHVAPMSHVSTRLLPQDDCDLIEEDRARKVRKEGIRIDRLPVVGACRLHMPEDPALPTVAIVATSEDRHGLFLNARLRTVHIAGQNGQAATVTTGRAAVYPPIPLPALGCFVEGSDWRCTAGLMPLDYKVATDGGSGAPLVAAALQLPPRTYRTEGRTLVLDASEFAPQAALDQAVIAAQQDAFTDEERDMSILDRLIDDPTQPIGQLTPERVATYRTALAARAPRLVDGLGRAIDAGRDGIDARRVLGAAIVALPGNAFTAIGPALLATLKGRPAVREPNGFYARLGDLGPSVVPFLLETIDTSHMDVGAALALCRIGAPAASVARQRLADMMRNKLGKSREAASIALLRLGFRDVVAAYNTEVRTPLPPNVLNLYLPEVIPAVEAEYDRMVAEITPASPASVCRLAPD